MVFIQNPCKKARRININLIVVWGFLGFFTLFSRKLRRFRKSFLFRYFRNYAKFILPLIIFFLPQIARIYADFLYGFSSPKSIQKTEIKFPPEAVVLSSGGK